MPTDKPLPFMVYEVNKAPNHGVPAIEYLTKTERVNPRNLTEVLTQVAQALAKIGQNEGDYIIQCTYKFYNPAGNGKTIHIPQYLIDQYKEKGKN
jgi:hypothetical protein